MQLETLCRINLLYIAPSRLLLASSGSVECEGEREFMNFLKGRGQ